MAGTALLGLGSGVVFIAGAMPATAATLARQPDTQVAVFMLPLILLVSVLLFEVARIVWRGKVPATTPSPRQQRLKWTPGRGEG
ncbi:hypothetical protein IC608_00755 [Devosia sp. PTR5]|uniref:Uncharacterized protein n=1 Tax=Devosia oryzisoli TaxID=2774138 RepID=A0A927FRU7_9HYPH|nr:hypothetical protein [Devosia oryzisoli]MBD8064004.1 hypothetical protein [Devosia oryzisoli]